MKKIIAIIFLMVIVGGLYGYWRVQTANLPYERGAAATSLHSSLQRVTDTTSAYVAIGDTVLLVEVVNTPKSITQGLSGRPEIGADGMLFVLPVGQVPVFWMKDMRFDLDFVWIADEVVQEITPNVQAPNPETTAADLPHYSPSGVAELVLEIPAGKAADLAILPGDEVSLVDESKYQR